MACISLHHAHSSNILFMSVEGKWTRLDSHTVKVMIETTPAISNPHAFLLKNLGELSKLVVFLVHSFQSFN